MSAGLAASMALGNGTGASAARQKKASPAAAAREQCARGRGAARRGPLQGGAAGPRHPQGHAAAAGPAGRNGRRSCSTTGGWWPATPRAGTATTRSWPWATSTARWRTRFKTARYRDDAVAGLPGAGGGVPQQPAGREGALRRRGDRPGGRRPEADRRGRPRVPRRLSRVDRGRPRSRRGAKKAPGPGGGAAHAAAAGGASPRCSTCASGAASLDARGAGRGEGGATCATTGSATPTGSGSTSKGTRLHPNLVDRMFPVGDGLLEQIRVGQNRDSVVRVVLDFRDVKDHTIFYLENPMRLVVDVRGRRGRGWPPSAGARRPRRPPPRGRGLRIPSSRRTSRRSHPRPARTSCRSGGWVT